MLVPRYPVGILSIHLIRLKIMTATPEDKKEVEIPVKPRRGSMTDAVLVRMHDLRITGKLNHARFSGRHVRGNSTKVANIRKRDKRLGKYGYSVLMFAS